MTRETENNNSRSFHCIFEVVVCDEVFWQCDAGEIFDVLVDFVYGGGEFDGW